jgi:hypothetical protein
MWLITRFMPKHKWSMLGLCSLVLVALLVVACGGGSESTASSSAVNSSESQSAHLSANTSGYSNTSGSSSSSSPSLPTTSPKSNQPKSVQQYVNKTLNISMQVDNTQKVASNLQSWISTTDSLATATSVNYQQVGNNLYNVSMSFSVQASLFPQIEAYLNSYPAQHGGKLLNTTLNTQDMSNDYIDTQAQVTDLKAEQQRLLVLMGQATKLNDVLNINQQLTGVEGQLDQIEAHLNDLRSQTTFYTVSISLQPTQIPVAPTQPQAPTWSPLAIWHGALSASIAVAETLLTVIIWLLAFSVYIIPVGVLAWFVRRWRHLHMIKTAPKIAATTLPPQPM